MLFLYSLLHNGRFYTYLPCNCACLSFTSSCSSSHLSWCWDSWYTLYIYMSHTHFLLTVSLCSTIISELLCFSLISFDASWLISSTYDLSMRSSCTRHDQLYFDGRGYFTFLKSLNFLISVSQCSKSWPISLDDAMAAYEKERNIVTHLWPLFVTFSDTRTCWLSTFLLNCIREIASSSECAFSSVATWSSSQSLNNPSTCASISSDA